MAPNPDRGREASAEEERMRRFLAISCAAALAVAFSVPAVGPAGHASAASPPQLEKFS